MLEQMKEAQEKAQTELASADIALMEATARQQSASEAATRLDSAVAALCGEKPPAKPSAPLIIEDTHTGERHTVESVPGTIITDKDARREMSYEEFEADRVARQRAAKRAAKKEAIANNPLGHLKCNGCGQVGTLQDSMVQAPSGATVRMMVCTSCNNQIMT